MSRGHLDEILERYEPVIGLEVHTHLRTKSKLFSPSPVRYGDPPNHDVHPIDLALPGVLPVLNAQVVELAIRLGLAINGTVNTRSIFARKNYFYPDLPKGYQISQFEEPVVNDGWIEIDVPVEGSENTGSKGETRRKRVGVTRAHLEEDAGKSVHDSAVAGSDDTHLDFNRAGVPLLEIVSEPDLRSAAEAGAYLRTMRQILRYIDVSEADMEKGQFRCDANVSLRPRGQEEFGTRTELKNINSFRFVEEAIDAEIERQADVLDEGGEIRQATMAYDPASGRTRVLRLKEDANDYRYFPDPDLIPLLIAEAQIEEVRAAMPELPQAKRARLAEVYGLSEQDAGQLAASRDVADFFEATTGRLDDSGKNTRKSGKSVANWVLRDVLQALKERDAELGDAKITPAALAALLRLVDEGRLTAQSAREILPELVDSGADPEALMRERGLEAVSDTNLIDEVVDRVIAENDKAAAEVRGGDDKPLNFLMGQVMKQMQGKANPGQVRKSLAARLKG